VIPLTLEMQTAGTRSTSRSWGQVQWEQGHHKQWEVGERDESRDLLRRRLLDPRNSSCRYRRHRWCRSRRSRDIRRLPPGQQRTPQHPQWPHWMKAWAGRAEVPGTPQRRLRPIPSWQSWPRAVVYCTTTATTPYPILAELITRSRLLHHNGDCALSYPGRVDHAQSSIARRLRAIPSW